MRAFTGTWGLLRALGGRAARGLAAVEPQGMHARARCNAATSAAQARARRLEAEESGRWIEALQACGAAPAVEARRRSTRS